MAEVVRTDYDGDTAYATFGFDATNQLVRRESWEPGLARVQQPSFPTATGDYFHADHLGTTRHMSVGEGDVFEPAAYTAFGEQVSGMDFARFGYAGAWGYQANPGFPFLHVGARYYDPASGRFLQRDPIGGVGGLNVYQYVKNSPGGATDPTGLRAIQDDWGPLGGHPPDKVEREGVQRGATVACAAMVGAAFVRYAWRIIVRPRPPRPPRPEPYPVAPAPPPSPDPPPQWYPSEDDHVVPSTPPNLPNSPPEYDPNEEWPSG